MAEGVPVKIIGYHLGNGHGMEVTEEGNIVVLQQNFPYYNSSKVAPPYVSFFTNSAGSSDMRVDGSTTPVEFSIKAEWDREVWIKTINILLADAGAKLNNFGNIAALTNGVEFSYKSAIGDTAIDSGIKNNIGFFRYTKQEPKIIDLSGAGADAVIVTIDLAELCGNPFGVHLRKGSTDRISFTVKDDLATSPPDQFDIKGIGQYLM